MKVKINRKKAIIISIAIFALLFILYLCIPWEKWNLSLCVFFSKMIEHIIFPAIATFIGGFGVYIARIKGDFSEMGKSMKRNASMASYEDGADFKAVSIWEELAGSDDDPASQNALGYMYAMRKGVAESEENDKAAVELFRKAAKGGNAMAHYNLGEMYRDGRIDGRVNNTLSYMWYYIAKENGIELAQQELDALEEDGRTPSGNKKIAIQYAEECIKSNYIKYNP